MSVTETEYLTRLREALAALRKVRGERDDLLREKSAPIAIVGMSCRFPGGGENPDAYWQSLLGGVDAVRKIVPERLPENILPEDKPGAQFAALLDGLDQFDAGFFGMSPREADALDPQQRLLLEVAWEALENAGVPQEKANGSRTGVFVGITGLDYQRRVLDDAQRFDMYSATGNMLATSAGRIAYTFGLQGPTMALDTACSSALVAVHLACQSLRQGDCDMALAGGVNAILAWQPMLMLANMQALSPDGRCKTFDSRANGYVRGEGCGLFVLKRLDDALRHHDRIYACIRGSAINQDGRSTGLTTPNVRAQEALLKQALANARVSADEIGYIETHGTGTALGDPIEFDALRRVFGNVRQHGRPCILGAVKTNLGHLESAAGAASLMKAVLALRHGVVPQNIHFRTLNPRISLAGTPFVIPTDAMTWKPSESSRLAGVSGFGLSGTNAHIILEEAPREEAHHDVHEPGVYVLPLSAKTPRAVATVAQTWAAYLTSNPAGLSEVCYSASLRRTHHEHRRAVIGTTREELVDALKTLSTPDGMPSIEPDTALTAPPVVFVFSGQGSQWAGMGRHIFEAEPVFRQALTQIDAELSNHTKFSVIEQIHAPENQSRLGETIVAQPAIFAVQVALCALLNSWGIAPAMVLGHSIGELAAAYVAGILDAREASRLVALRSRIMQQATGQGKMATIGISEMEAVDALKGFGERVSIAAVNDRSQVVVSGDPGAVDELVELMDERGIQCRPLRVNYAFHSHQMEPFGEKFVEALGPVASKSGTVPMMSTVSATLVDGKDLDTTYWGRNIRQSVRFSDAIERVCDAGPCIFIEIGPHPVLSLNVEQILSARQDRRSVLSTLRRQKDDRLQLYGTLAAAYSEGISIHWDKLSNTPLRHVPLPSYPWQRKHHWIVADTTAQRPRTPMEAPEGHYALAGMPVHVPGDGLFQSLRIHPQTQPYLSDHIVHGHEVVPGAFYLAVLLAIATERLGATSVTLKDVLFVEALALEREIDLYVYLRPRNNNEYEFSVSTPLLSSNDTPIGYREHTRGLLCLDAKPQHDRTALAPEHQARHTELDPERFFQKLSQIRIDWGPRWRWIRHAHATERGIVASLRAAEGTNPSDAPLHPILIDNSFACAGWQTEQDTSTDAETTPRLPLALKEFRWFGIATSEARVHFRRSAADSAETTRGDLTIVSTSGEIICEIDEFVLKRAPRQAFFRQHADELLFAQDFQASPIPESPNASSRDKSRWLLIGDDNSHLVELHDRLQQRGITSVIALFDHLEESLDPEPNLSVAPSVTELLATLQQSAADGPWSGIICWWSASGHTPVETAIPAMAERNALLALHLLQALLQFTPQASPPTVPRWIWITEASLPVGDRSSPALELASLWGLGRTVQQEHPEFGLKLVDVEKDSERALHAIEREVLHQDDEPQIVWRDNQRLVPRLVHVPAADKKAQASLSLSKGTVLITGGLGALGLHLAHWFWTEHRVGHLLLLSRRVRDAQVLEEVNRLREQGANITVAHVDVSDAIAIQEIIAVLPENLPLVGVVHAAGVVDDGILSDQTDARFAAVFAPKVRGAWNLHLATRDKPLQFFVLFSSIAALFGSAGQGNYAAANAFLDGLADARRMAGLPALSLNWGPWSAGGMVADLSDSLQARMLRKGFRALDPARALGALGLSLSRTDSHVAIFSHDLAAIVRAADHHVPPLWRAPAATPAPAPTREPTESLRTNPWLEQLAHVDLAARKANIETALCADVARVLGASSPGDVQKDRPLQDQGLDSLMAVELRNAIGKRIGKSLPATLVFDRPTVHALASYVLELIAEPANQPIAKTPAPVAPPRTATTSTQEPIAIIGVGCRYPGGVLDLTSFWNVLDQEIDTIHVVPGERWNADDYYDARAGAPGKVNTREGGFLSNIDLFDTYFFGISPREAVTMDPQQRLLLETTWEALEHAGILANDLQGSETGVFVGLMYHDYDALLEGNLELVDGYVGTGTAGSVASGRLSYVFGLNGPSMTVDTACSSSLVTVHLAVRSLRSGECSIALAGGVALMLTPATFVAFNSMQNLAADGRCKPFDANANGIGWGEGCGMFVLKRLSDAVRDRDRIVAVIRGTAVNQDGRSNGLLAPNGLAQEKLLRRVLQDAGVTASEVDYVEAFGAGTSMGDVIEVQALGNVFGVEHSAERPLFIGSAKSNFGHTQSAAGAAGIIKTALALQHEKIPRSLHLTQPNPAIPWSDLHIQGVAQAQPWPRNGNVRRAGISSFGLSGTNAHVLLEEAPPPKVEVSPPLPHPYLLPLSAKKPEALREIANSYAQWLPQEKHATLHDIVYTASVRRVHHEHRVAMLVRDVDESIDLMRSVADGHTRPGVAQRTLTHRGNLQIGFIFSDLDAEWNGVGKTIFRDDPTFRRKLLDVDAVAQRVAHISFAEYLQDPSESASTQTPEIAPLVLFAIQVALVELYGSWGIYPKCVLGYGAGEITAAHVCGALSLEAAVRLIISRARVLQSLVGKGSMLRADLSASDATPMIEGREDKLSIAAINDPHSIIFSGDAEILDKLREQLDRQDIPTNKLPATFAAHHSPLLGPLARKVVAAIGRQETKVTSLTIFSTLTGRRIDGTAFVAEYWGLNMISTVNLAGAVDEAIQDGCQILMEFGAQPLLVPHLERCSQANKKESRILQTLGGERDEWATLLETLAALYVEGADLRWNNLFPEGGDVVSLPAYAWQRERFWIDQPEKPRIALAQHSTKPTSADVPNSCSEDAEPGLEEPLKSTVSRVLDVSAPTKSSHTQRAQNDVIANSLFNVVWQRKDSAFGPASTYGKSGSWMVILDQSGFGTALADEMRARGSRVVEILDGDSYSRLVGDGYRLDCTNPKHWEKVLSTAFGKRGCRGVIHCSALDATTWTDMNEQTLASDIRRGSLCVLRIAQSLLTQVWRDTPRLHIITRGAQAIGNTDSISPAQASLWGLGRVIALEHSKVGGMRIDLPMAPMAEELDFILRELEGLEDEDQVALRTDGRYVTRLVRSRWDVEPAVAFPQRPAATHPYELTIESPGILENLQLRGLHRRAPGPGEVEIEVEAAGLNFIDVLKAMGIYPGMDPAHIQLGGECAGRIVAVGQGVQHLQVGQEVMACTGGSFATHVTTRAEFVAPLPTGLSYEQAAAIPSVFMTIYWALHHVARLQAGERILIHSATGGTGLAAIQYAKAVGAHVFATAGNAEKRDFLRSLGIDHVMDSRTLSFADEVLASTNGRGVDVVLNSLTGNALVKSLELLAPYGRFLEIGKKDIYDDRQLGLLPFRKALSYTAVDLVGMATDRPDQFASLLAEVGRLLEDGTFQPLPVTVFPVSEADAAFRLMAQARHMGKIVLRLRDPKATISMAAQRPATIASDATYLIAGGLGTLGLSLAKWIVQQGGRHLALVSRNAPDEAELNALRELERLDADIRTFQANIAHRLDIDAVMTEIDQHMPALRGVFNTAAAAVDQPIASADEMAFLQQFEPKLFGGWNLHMHTVNRRLDFFVSFSSAASVLGSCGRAAEASADAFMDALCIARTAKGLPGTSIHWGALGDGETDLEQVQAKHVIACASGFFTPEEQSAFFARALAHPRPVIDFLRIEKANVEGEHGQLSQSPLTRDVQLETAADHDVSTQPPQTLFSQNALLESLHQALAEDRIALLEDHLCHRIGQVLRMDPNRIDRYAPFSTLGMDSLMSLELRNRLEADLTLKLPAALLFAHPTPAALAEQLIHQLAFEPEKRLTLVPVAPVAAPLDEAPQFDDESDLDIEARLEAKLAMLDKYLDS